MLHIYSDYKNHLIEVIRAYNFLEQSTIGFCPGYLMFGLPRLIIDILEIKGDPPRENRKAYLSIWKYKMHEIFLKSLR